MKHYNHFFVFIIAIFLSVSGCAAKTPLIKASASGDSLAVQRLVNEGANVNVSDSKGYTPLMNAVWSGNIETVKVLVNKGGDINAKDSSGYTPLLWASYYGFLDIAKLLIDKGADINARSDDKSSPLLLATWSNDELSKLLIDKGVDINAQDASGATPLHNSDSLSLIQYLLDRHANTSLKNERGWTALRQAIYDKKIAKVALIRKNTNWQEEIIYSLTTEEKRGLSEVKPDKDMFDVPTDKERAFKIATYDCNAMLFSNVESFQIFADINYYGLPYFARKVSRALTKKGLFQTCMALMGFECKKNCSNDSKPVAAISETSSSKTIKVPAQNVSNSHNIDYLQYSQSLVRGKTTKQDVEKDLSKPTEQSYSGEYEYCAYYYKKLSPNSDSLIPYRLTLKYDNQGVLCDYVNVVVRY